jgi:hypothetical protein
MTGWAELDRFLHTDPADVGCEQALKALHIYVDLILTNDGGDAVRRYPAVAAHLLACRPCEDDFEGLLVAASGMVS